MTGPRCGGPCRPPARCHATWATGPPRPLCPVGRCHPDRPLGGHPATGDGNRPSGQRLDRTGLVGGDDHRGSRRRTPRGSARRGWRGPRRRGRRGARRAATARASGRPGRPGPPGGAGRRRAWRRGSWPDGRSAPGDPAHRRCAGCRRRRPAPRTARFRRRSGRRRGGRHGRAARPAASPGRDGATGSSPSTESRPEARGTSPAQTRSRLVLPAPLGPSTSTVSPAATSRSTPARSGNRPDNATASRRETALGGGAGSAMAVLHATRATVAGARRGARLSWWPADPDAGHGASRRWCRRSRPRSR